MVYCFVTVKQKSSTVLLLFKKFHQKLIVEQSIIKNIEIKRVVGNKISNRNWDKKRYSKYQTKVIRHKRNRKFEKINEIKMNESTERTTKRQWGCTN